MGFWWLLAGAMLSGPLWVLATVLVNRRVWLNVRRLTRRSRRYEHLVELGQLVGGLAHEIKNPLSTINMNLKLLAEDLGGYRDEDHRRWLRRLQSVQGETDRVREILDDFLRFAGRYELEPSRQDLRQVVQDVADFFNPQASAAGVVMRTTLGDQPVMVNIDARFIKQALLNLLLNAVHAMPQGGELLIRVGSSRWRGQVEVIDTGVGIAADELEKIFQVYYSTKKQGTGLGLPATRRIAQEHGGAVDVQSELGKGSRFVIYLPLAK